MNIISISAQTIVTFVVGLFLTFIPYITRHNECFAVTVPVSAQKDPRMISLKKHYVVEMLLTTILATISSVIAGKLLTTNQTIAGLTLLYSALVIPAIVSFVLMLHARSKVVALKKSEGWDFEQHKMTASVIEKDFPNPISLRWNLMYIPIILGTVCLGFVLYPSMPDMLPMHADFTGTVDSYTPKTFGSALGFPVALEVFMAACFIFSHWMIVHSKHAVDPSEPATSAFSYGVFARAQSIFLFIIGLLISGGLGVLFILASAGRISLGQVGFIAEIFAVLTVVGILILSAVYGQSGSRVFRKLDHNENYLSDEDRHWKLGVFYFNREDASIFLPKRFGVGWTMNFARPAVWVIIVGLIIFPIVFVVLVSYLAG